MFEEDYMYGNCGDNGDGPYVDERDYESKYLSYEEKILMMFEDDRCDLFGLINGLKAKKSSKIMTAFFELNGIFQNDEEICKVFIKLPRRTRNNILVCRNIIKQAHFSKRVWQLFPQSKKKQLYSEVKLMFPEIDC